MTDPYREMPKLQPLPMELVASIPRWPAGDFSIGLTALPGPHLPDRTTFPPIPRIHWTWSVALVVSGNPTPTIEPDQARCIAAVVATMSYENEGSCIVHGPPDCKIEAGGTFDGLLILSIVYDRIELLRNHARIFASALEAAANRADLRNRPL